ncbi:MAG: sugar phosphate isomerase/epimerase family protein [Candidatus Thorarchaeota archaeon]|jgi:sugar phosphate isomerase/epimerase
MSSLNIGCALWTLGPTPDVKTLRRHMETVAAIGCTSVQPWIVNVEYTPCILDPEVGSEQDRKAVIKAAKELGLTFSGFCAQLLGSKTYGGLEEEDGLPWRIKKTKQALTTAAELGSSIVTTHAGIMPENPQDPAYQTLLRSVDEIAEHAEKLGVYFAMETGQETPQALLQFIKTVGNPHLKVNYDPCNLLRFGSQEGVIAGVTVLKDYIVHTHAKDWNPETKRATCGQGKVPWREYIAALKKIGYKGVYAIEDETGVKDMIDSIRTSYAFLRQF